MGKMIIYAIAVVSIVMFALQVVALAHDGAYVDAKGRDYYCGDCGIFDCMCGGTLFNDGCGDRADHMKAAAAFGVLACLLIALSMIVHVMLCFGKTAGMLMGNSIGSKLVSYMWAVHLVSCLFNIICWACLAGAYDRKLCGWKLKNYYNLTFGFVFLIINTVCDAILAYCCWKHMHVGYSSGGGGGGYRGPPPGYYQSNPIDRQGFHGRRY